MIDDEPSLLAVLPCADAHTLHRGGKRRPEISIILIPTLIALRGVDPRPAPKPRRGSKRTPEV